MEFRLVYVVMSVFKARSGIGDGRVNSSSSEISLGLRGNVFTAWSGSGDGRGNSLQFKVRSRTLVSAPCYYKLN